MKFNFFPIKRLFQIIFLSLFVAIVSFDVNAAFDENTNKRKISKKQLELLLGLCGGGSDLGSFNIAAYGKYPPFSWKVQNDVQKKYEGFVPEIVHKALNDIGIKKIHENFYDSTEDMLKDATLGKIDIIFTTSYDARTIKVMDLIYPAYFGNPISLISRKDNIIQDDQLSGKIGAIIVSEGLGGMISGILPTDAKLMEVEDFNVAYKKLLSKEIDFIVAGKYLAMSEASALGIKNRISIPNKNFKTNKIFAGFSKVSKCHYFKEGFENAFKKYFEDKDASRDRMKKAIESWADYKKQSGDLVEMPADETEQPATDSENKTDEITEETTEQVAEQTEVTVEQNKEVVAEEKAPVEEKQAEPVVQQPAEVIPARPPVFRKPGEAAPAPTNAPTRPPVFKRPVEGK